MIQTSNQVKFRVAFLTVLFLFASVVLFAQAADDLRLRKVSLTAEDASISSLLSTIAKLSNCNIVVASDIAEEDGESQEARITVSLKDVPVEQALSLIVKSAGLSYRFVGDNTFLVGQRDRIREEVGERSYFVQLNHVSAEKILNSVKIIGGENVEIEVVEGENALMVYANPDTYNDIIRRVEELDKPKQQIEIRARLIEVSLNDTKKLGIDWSKLNNLTTIIAENPVNGEGVGLPYNYGDETGTLPFGDLTDLGKLPEEQYFQKIDGFNDVGRFSRQLTAFDITIDWLLENNAAKLLTDTRITALNAEDAEIFIGEITPFVVMNNDKEVQVEREETGIKLHINARINNEGHITAYIAPEVSSITDLVGGYVPRTKQRRVSTTVTVPNGQKIHVGGLLSSNLINTTIKVPFLGDIPFIGRFFQHQYTNVQNTDLVIEITPRVVNIAEEQYDYEVDERLGRELIKKHSNDDKE
ncbi:MAG: secretin N-terminal domain-containing protein [Candidatus Cloacimonetes bacterium]|nr:secretin N-terminal domain-containing protein [Candidatus Cloacimonadota bacterium]